MITAWFTKKLRSYSHKGQELTAVGVLHSERAVVVRYHVAADGWRILIDDRMMSKRMKISDPISDSRRNRNLNCPAMLTRLDRSNEGSTLRHSTDHLRPRCYLSAKRMPFLSALKSGGRSQCTEGIFTGDSCGPSTPRHSTFRSSAEMRAERINSPSW